MSHCRTAAGWLAAAQAPRRSKQDYVYLQLASRMNESDTRFKFLNDTWNTSCTCSVIFRVVALVSSSFLLALHEWHAVRDGTRSPERHGYVLSPNALAFLAPVVDCAR